MTEMLTSTTRFAMMFMIVVLSILMVYTLAIREIDLFKLLFAVFANVLTGTVGYFIGKSATDSAKTPTQNTPQPAPETFADLEK